VTVSMLNAPLITLNSTSYTTLKGLIFECSRGTGVTVTSGAHNSVVNCTLRNLGNTGVDIEGGSYHAVTNCVLTGEGDGGIIVNGTSLSANNNEIAHYARWVYCYRPALRVLGSSVGVAHNKIYDSPHSAVVLDGQSQVVEYNEIAQVCLQTQDAGAIYTGDGTTTSNTFRYNFIHDMGLGGINNAQYSATVAIYLDNASSRVTVLGNVIANCNVGVLVGGGSRDTVQNNIITNCAITVHVDGRSGTPKFDTITTNVLYGGNFEFLNNVQRSITLTNNLINVNPLFVDPAQNNYQLQPNSPAYSQITGFQTIPFSQIGRQ